MFSIKNYKNLSIALSFMTIASFSNITTHAFTEPVSTNISVNVELQQKGAVNWDKGAESDVTAIYHIQ